tara:strand:+ start:1306 stop:1620 length:315 start_codon:yes stop_codon:yes gene_type:complete
LIVTKARTNIEDDVHELLGVVCRAFGVQEFEVLGPTREDAIIIPRFALYSLLRGRMHSYTKIGNALGKDHGTIMYGVRSLKNRIATEKKMRKAVEVLEREGYTL